jgi:hypothetical protein
MHQADPYGYLVLPRSIKDGAMDTDKDVHVPILPKVLARMVGCEHAEVEQRLAELEEAGVFSRDQRGTIFSRRMVIDEKLRQVRAAGGVSSLKNPRVPRPKDASKDGPKDARNRSLRTSFDLSPAFAVALADKNSSGAVARGEVESDSTDLRHFAIRGLIQKLHLEKFEISCQWDGSEGKALQRVLAGNPTWNEQQLRQMVENRFESDVSSERPRVWLPRLGDYASGPQDRYGKPKPETNGASPAVSSNYVPASFKLRAEIKQESLSQPARRPQ